MDERGSHGPMDRCGLGVVQAWVPGQLCALGSCGSGMGDSGIVWGTGLDCEGDRCVPGRGSQPRAH